MRFFSITLMLSGLLPALAFSGVTVLPLQDKDLSVLSSGAGCWLENKKAEQFIYDDMNIAAIKINSQTIKLTRKTGDWNSGFYSCGKNYDYISNDQKTNVSIKMNSSKSKNCTGKLTIKTSSGSTTINSLSSNCGA